MRRIPLRLLITVFGLILAIFSVEAVHACSMVMLDPDQGFIRIHGLAPIDSELIQDSCLGNFCEYYIEETYRNIEEMDFDFEVKERIALPGHSQIASIDIFDGKTMDIEYSIKESKRLRAIYIDTIKLFVDTDISDISSLLFRDHTWDTYEPYSEAAEQALREQKVNLALCRYSEYSRVGNWLVSQSLTREYCEYEDPANGRCPFLVVSEEKLSEFIKTYVPDDGSTPVLTVEHDPASTAAQFPLRLLITCSAVAVVAFVLWSHIRSKHSSK